MSVLLQPPQFLAAAAIPALILSVLWSASEGRAADPGSAGSGGPSAASTQSSGTTPLPIDAQPVVLRVYTDYV